MRKHMRNFWLMLQAEDRVGTGYETTAATHELGTLTVQACQFKLRIYEREEGQIRDVYEVTGRCADEGALIVEIKDATGRVVCSHKTPQ